MNKLSHSDRHLNTRQRGAALLIMMVIFVLFFASVLLASITRLDVNGTKRDQTSRVLAQAKELLVNYALLSDQRPGSPGVGFLPCPDRDGDGLSDTPCDAPGLSVEGWLPWQTLGSQPLKDGDGACLRYAVSGNYKIDPALPLVKSPRTPGHFIIHDANHNIRIGRVAADYALAVVFAPAATVAGQSRGSIGGASTYCGNTNVSAAISRAENYLDQLRNVDNASGRYYGPGLPGSSPLPTQLPSVFIQAEAADEFNDQLIWISPRDFVDVYARMP